MKKLFALALLASSSVFSQQVAIVETVDGDTWFGYPSTIKNDLNRISVQVGYKPKDKEETVMHVSVEQATCNAKRGAIYVRERENARWTKTADVTLTSIDSVADHLALILCSIGNQRKSRMTV